MNYTTVIDTVKKIGLKLVDTRAAGIYIILFAAAIGIATFIENDYGTSSAQKVIFKARWFELLLVLFAASLVANIIKYRMVQNKKWALLILHTSMIIILMGAGITRYWGYEGIMHIREDNASNTFLSAETYLNFELLAGGQRYQFEEPVLFATLGDNNFKESYLIGNDLIEVEVKDFIPNPKQSLDVSDQGMPTIKIVFGSSSGREEYFITQGEKKRFRGVNFNFTDAFNPNAVTIYYNNNSLFIRSAETLMQTVMATQQKDTLLPREEPYELKLRSLYVSGANSFVFGEFNPSGKVVVQSDGPKVKNESMTALDMEVKLNGVPQQSYLYGKKGLPGRAGIFRNDKMSLAISYGAKTRNLPFNIRLHQFIMERYPGTNSAASYASEVTLEDSEKNINMDYRIYMNHILDHRGYRFFQSSFDKDEKGTYLSVNHDFVGTWVSYLGYALLTIGMIWLFLSRRTRFYQVSKKVRDLSAKTAYVWVFLFLSTFTTISAQKVISANYPSVNNDHANLFSKVVVQDHKGRMKPMHTLTRELMRKVSRKESFEGLNADQVILSMFADKSSWLAAPLIKIAPHQQLHAILGSSSERVSYKDFFAENGEYKLRDLVRKAYGLQPIDRGQLEKDVMKIDERVNIVNMVFSGSIFKIIPLAGDANNTWTSSHSAGHGTNAIKNPVAQKFFPSYKQSLFKAIKSDDYLLPNQILEELATYQKDKGGAVMPSSFQIKAERFLNELNVFNRLSAYYSILGVLFLVMLFVSIFRSQTNLRVLYKVLLAFVFLGFALHTLGLGLRWYVSERAPWSNGYESMIYIAWTSTLAGIIFTRKSLGGLAATMILAGTILLVAMLSYLDPEITPLVPVLRSYWLTIHVSLIAGSYGFLMLGAIIGLINLSLMMFINKTNRKKLISKIQELSYISELTLTGGLVMISIGTYLGGVWANESWGRYWGWDAKETWALVTILVYAFILHMRLIPKLYGMFAFNLATLFGFASVIMTYFGVNYYLSGLHSYAAGDPVPIPQWVYISVVCVTLISIVAYVQNRRSLK